jgi:hypothetical protein
MLFDLLAITTGTGAGYSRWSAGGVDSGKTQVHAGCRWWWSGGLAQQELPEVQTLAVVLVVAGHGASVAITAAVES